MSDETAKERDLRQDMQIKQIMEKLDDVHTDVKKTNGRVSKLEIWQGYMIGAMTVITMIVVPVLIFLLKTHLS